MKKILKKVLPGVIACSLVAGGALPAMADPTDDYILFLPKNTGAAFSVDESHVSSEYSTGDYMILLYKPGEQVHFTVDTDKAFSLESALNDSNFDSLMTLSGQSVDFVMPEEDICYTVLPDSFGTMVQSGVDVSAEAEEDPEASISDIRESTEEEEPVKDMTENDIFSSIRAEEPETETAVPEEAEDISDEITENEPSLFEDIRSEETEAEPAPEPESILGGFRQKEVPVETDNEEAAESDEEVSPAEEDESPAEIESITEVQDKSGGELDSTNSADNLFGNFRNEEAAEESEDEEPEPEGNAFYTEPEEDSLDKLFEQVKAQEESESEDNIEAEADSDDINENVEGIVDEAEEADEWEDFDLINDTEEDKTPVLEDEEQDLDAEEEFFQSEDVEEAEEETFSGTFTIKNVSGHPVVLMFDDGTAEEVEAYLDGSRVIESIEVLGDFNELPQPSIEATADGIDAFSSLIREKKILENGHLYLLIDKDAAYGSNIEVFFY